MTVYYLMNMDEVKPVARFETELIANEIGRTAKYSYIVISKEADIEAWPVKVINALRVGLGLAPKIKKKKEIALAGVWEALEALEFEAPKLKPKATKTPREKRVTRRDKIVKLFEENDGEISLEQIQEAIQFKDRKSTSACMTMLGSAKYTKDPLTFAWDREKKVYVLGKEKSSGSRRDRLLQLFHENDGKATVKMIQEALGMKDRKSVSAFITMTKSKKYTDDPVSIYWDRHYKEFVLGEKPEPSNNVDIAGVETASDAE